MGAVARASTAAGAAKPHEPGRHFWTHRTVEDGGNIQDEAEPLPVEDEFCELGGARSAHGGRGERVCTQDGFRVIMDRTVQLCREL